MALAGCFDNAPGGDGASPAQQPEPGQQRETGKHRETDGLGALRGVVVDVAIRPLDGANVGLVPGDLSTTTDPDGEFSFDRLRPGSYALTVSREGYLDSTTTVAVAADEEGPSIQVVLEIELNDTRFANLYKYEGLYECGVWPTGLCQNVNIVTGIMLCETPVPCFNATADSSVFLQWVDPGMQFLQTEMSWTPTFDFGKELLFLVGGATKEELASGFAPTYNETEGPSPLMVTLDNVTLSEAGIGQDRAMFVQIGSGGSDTVPGGCVVYNPCGPTVHFQQPFQVFTTTFYGYLPPPGWLFAETGEVPPPPPQ